MERIAWSNPKCKIVTSVSHINYTLELLHFETLKLRESQNDFLPDHKLEIIEEVEPTIIQEDGQSSREDAYQERIRSPSRNRILRI